MHFASLVCMCGFFSRLSRVYFSFLLLQVAVECSQWDRRDHEGAHQYAAIIAAARPEM